MLRFQSVDLSNAGPFDAEQSLQFSEGLTLVAGDNESGTGRATILEALHRQCRFAFNPRPGRANTETPRWLVFLDGAVRTPHSDAPWAPLVALMSSRQELHKKRSAFEDELTMNIRQMLRTKIGSSLTKFSSRVTSPDQLNFTLAEDGAVIVTIHTGERCRNWFDAVGESLVLYLSINAAVRKVLLLDIPFVVDSQLGEIENSLLQPCYQFMSVVSQQTIIIESSQVCKRLGIAPHIQIVSDLRTGKSSICGLESNIDQYWRRRIYEASLLTF